MLCRATITLALLASLATANVEFIEPKSPHRRTPVVHVRDVLTGVPLVGARVSFDSHVEASLTDLSGTTTFDTKVSPDSRVSAVLSGYRRSYGYVWRTTNDTFYATCELPRITKRTVVCRVTDGETGFPTAFASIRIDGAVGSSDLFGRCVLRGRLPNRSGFKVDYAMKPCATARFMPGPGDVVYASVALHDSTPAGTIAGHVGDGTVFFADASVVLHNTELGAATEPNGNYTISGVTPGDYLAEVNRISVHNQTRWVSVRPGRTTRVNWIVCPLW